MTPVKDRENAHARLRVATQENVIDPSENMYQSFLTFHQAQGFFKPGAKELAPSEAVEFLGKRVAWTEHKNVYAPNMQALGLLSNFKYVEPSKKRPGLAGWNEFWKLNDTGSTEGVIRYQGGDLIVKLNAAPETITPDDFRLAKGSAGKGQGEGGKDLGADVDLVGPGEPYEKWKKTPEYAQWRKTTDELMAKAVEGK